MVLQREPAGILASPLRGWHWACQGSPGLGMLLAKQCLAVYSGLLIILNMVVSPSPLERISVAHSNSSLTPEILP